MGMEKWLSPVPCLDEKLEKVSRWEWIGMDRGDPPIVVPIYES